MREVLYKKVGKRYVPLNRGMSAEEEDNFCIGNHLVMRYANGQSIVAHIDPEFAPMIAAGRYGTEEMTNVIREASGLRPSTTPITPGQCDAWNKLSLEFGTDKYTLTIPSAYEICQAAVDAMAAESAHTLKNPAVKMAYDHFMLVYKLSKENNGK